MSKKRHAKDTAGKPDSDYYGYDAFMFHAEDNIAAYHIYMIAWMELAVHRAWVDAVCRCVNRQLTFAILANMKKPTVDVERETPPEKIVKYYIVISVVLFSLSFWSSGVFLIRALGSYDVWNSGIRLGTLFALSIPLVYISIASVKKIFARIGGEAAASVHYIIALVVLLHALVLSTYPGVYGFTPSPALAASSWLLWFGGVAMVVVRLTVR